MFSQMTIIKPRKHLNVFASEQILKINITKKAKKLAVFSNTLFMPSKFINLHKKDVKLDEI